MQTLIRVKTSVSRLKNEREKIDHSSTLMLVGLVQSSRNLSLVVILPVWHPFDKLKSNKTISLSQSGADPD